MNSIILYINTQISNTLILFRIGVNLTKYCLRYHRVDLLFELLNYKNDF